MFISFFLSNALPMLPNIYRLSAVLNLCRIWWWKFWAWKSSIKCKFPGKYHSERFSACMCECIYLLRSICRHRNLIICVESFLLGLHFSILIFAPRKLTHLYVISSLLYLLAFFFFIFWLCLAIGELLQDIQRYSFFWYLVERFPGVALVTEAITAPVPSMLAVGL